MFLLAFSAGLLSTEYQGLLSEQLLYSSLKVAPFIFGLFAIIPRSANGKCNDWRDKKI